MLSGMRSIELKFPEMPIQNQMERQFSKSVFRKFWTTSRGSPFSLKFGNSGNFLFHWGFHFGNSFKPPAHPAVIGVVYKMQCASL